MIKEIKYDGFTASPSDYECPDGDLAGALNIVPEDGALKPVFSPSIILSLGDAKKKIMFIHETNTFKHYIVQDTGTSYGNALSWISDTSKVTLTALNVDNGIAFDPSGDLYQVNAIGNTLIVQTSSGTYYWLWKGDAEGYLYLGTHLPEIPISFGLQGEMVRTDEFSISFNNISEGDIWNKFSDENKDKITPQVLAKVNKFIAEQSVGKGRFIYPFFVRYAYRLYDQSLTMHSAPILMICSSDLAPQVMWTHITGKGSYTDAKLRIIGMVHQLDYAVIDSNAITQLKKWSDIVKSVDIFISKPIYTYDQNGQCTKFSKVSDGDCYCVCKHTNTALDSTTYPQHYQKWKFSELYANTFDPANHTYADSRVMIPQRSEEQIKADIRDTNLFYLLKAINIDDLKTDRTLIPINKDYLESLATRENMTDDYDSHDSLVSRYSFTYNQRLNLANIEKKLYNSFCSGAMINYSNGNVHYYSDAEPTILDRTIGVYVYFFIKEDGKDIVVNGKGYPLGINYEVSMEAHDFLNGAFYFGGWKDLSKQSSTTPSASSDADRTVEVKNKIYTSQVNNPFLFPVTNINTVGTGKILGISTAAKALSQGQFGQFPLYAFTTEGVWALEVNTSTGSYSAKQPITRDVCINANSITQIDSAVLFVTDRGIMIIEGSDSICISDVLDSLDTFDPLNLPCGDKLINTAGLEKKEVDYIPFKEYIKDCGLLYNYTYQRIIVYNPSKSYAYVYSKKSKSWGIMSSNIQSGVNSYPECYAVDTNGNLVDISTPNDGQSANGIFYTRPLKLDAANVLKTITTIIQRGHFRKGHVRQVLYGSRDLFNWELIWSSTDQYLRGFSGTPYKFFRIVVIFQLNKDESIFGCTIQYFPRQNNQLR